jgi:hypothetical protein
MKACWSGALTDMDEDRGFGAMRPPIASAARE